MPFRMEEWIPVAFDVPSFCYSSVAQPSALAMCEYYLLYFEKNKSKYQTQLANSLGEFA